MGLAIPTKSKSAFLPCFQPSLMETTRLVRISTWQSFRHTAFVSPVRGRDWATRLHSLNGTGYSHKEQIYFLTLFLTHLDETTRLVRTSTWQSFRHTAFVSPVRGRDWATRLHSLNGMLAIPTKSESTFLRKDSAALLLSPQCAACQQP